jgi:hypothetical protein
MHFLNIDHQKYNNYTLKIYILNNTEYIEKNDLNELCQLMRNYMYRLKIEILNSIEERIQFNGKIYNFINIIKFTNLIKNKDQVQREGQKLYVAQKINLMSNTILYLIKNVKRIIIYPNNDFEIEKFKDEIKKLKIEINDLKKINILIKDQAKSNIQLKKEINDIKNIINYINNKINKFINNTEGPLISNGSNISNLEINCESIHTMHFPILNSN